ncbi:hypothetical protein, partial [Pseudomonas protegens]|uniref:hypothetical protein n=1 Tax=Pseudomonas protegens TaxID=380021 RepID=UPI00223A69B5
NSETPIAKAIGVLFLRGEKAKSYSDQKGHCPRIAPQPQLGPAPLITRDGNPLKNSEWFLLWCSSF